ncbi:transposable element Tcb2 transposase [Trichonephila clavipes]|nr:transposable element Tcb2 transposase [Trichonephila clavipes]
MILYLKRTIDFCGFSVPSGNNKSEIIGATSGFFDSVRKALSGRNRSHSVESNIAHTTPKRSSSRASNSSLTGTITGDTTPSTLRAQSSQILDGASSASPVNCVNGSETPKYEHYSSPTTPSLATGTTVFSTQTVRNRLHGVGLYALRPMVCVRLTSRHRRDRRERIFIWSDRGSGNNPAFVHESVRFGGGGVLVYGGISIDGRTDLYIIRDGPLTARRYRDEILRPIVVPYAAAIGDYFILMDDNCRPYRVNLVEDFLFKEGIVRMEWPACSPDMNPIEHV